MLGKISAVVGVAAGLALLSPVAASAGEARMMGDPTSMVVTVSGSTVTITATCVNSGVKAEVGIGLSEGQKHIDYHVMKVDGKKQSFTFTGVRPGRYRANLSCIEHTEGFGGLMRAFTVEKPAKPAPNPSPQVGVKPKGAPQTGGGPADDESTATPLVAGGAVALVGATGAGAWVLRRRAARR
ncbi:hypothetical protein [Amycolatopsis plumensis]|uniref:Gram-positive cocci surface proteins LPxTG domain-containing protein n=1 Tax=Amycolatopsis plumensis TaxID=236508 RepID=A0ABV5UEI2_9PSEU